MSIRNGTSRSGRCEGDSMTEGERMACRYAGIDWASEKHDVLVADEAGAEVLAATFAHDEKGLSALCRTLVRLEVGAGRDRAAGRAAGRAAARRGAAGVGVASEQGRGRPGPVPGLGREVRSVRRVRAVRARAHRSSPLPDPGARTPIETKAIRALTRAREDLVAARTGVMNQLRAELERFWPGPLRLFSHMDAEILLAFLERYPSPADAHGLGVARMQAFLAPRALLGRAAPDRADGQAPLSRARPGRRARARRPPPARAQLRGDDPHAERADQGSRARDPHPGPRAPGRADLPLAVQVAQQRDHRRGAAGGDRRLPRALPRPATRSPPTPARPPSPSSPANGRPPASAGRATSDCGSRSAGWRTAAATGTPGPRPSTPKPVSAVTSTPARSGPSAAPGAASCGNAGATTPPTTRHDTARCNATSPSPSRP